MRRIVFLFYLLLPALSWGQYSPETVDVLGNLLPEENTQMYIVNDTSYDVKFYHIDVFIGIDSSYIGGKVSCLIQSRQDNLEHISLDLMDYYLIDSISAPVGSYTFSNDILTLYFNGTFAEGDLIDFTIYYHGVPQLAGGYKGLRYETHNGNEPVIATLSTPYLSHTWFPCKDGTADKADSVYVDIRIPAISYNDIPLIALSNGILTQVEDLGESRIFHWQHRYPIVPYYVMIAISNYRSFQQIFTGDDYAFPIDYYVFDEHLNTAQSSMETFPDAVDFFSNIFGDYPFRNEKYGMTQLGFYGAIENQTNTIINNLSPSYFNTAVHELAHQWFGDMITCQNWHHAWLNEGFATYAAVLYQEHGGGSEVYHNAMEELEFYAGGTVYLPDDSDPFNIFVPIIYKKGAYVLHMLRGVMGDEDFFEALHSYAQTTEFQYNKANTENFKTICQAYSGYDLDAFFDQWIYDEYYPVYHYNYEYNSASGELGLTIVQAQSAWGWRPVFEMPLEIKVTYTDASDTLLHIYNDQAIQNFSFLLNKEVFGIIFDPHQWILKTAVFDEDINVGLSGGEASVFFTYPNPSKGRFIIDFGGRTYSGLNISLRDIGGKTIFYKKYSSPQSRILIYVPDFQNGMYFLDVHAKGMDFHEKIVLKK